MSRSAIGSHGHGMSHKKHRSLNFHGIGAKSGADKLAIAIYWRRQKGRASRATEWFDSIEALMRAMRNR